MKRLLAWILVLVLVFSGCTGAPANNTTEGGADTPPEPGLYDPNHTLQQQTDGAVRVYPLGIKDCGGIGFMGKDVLIFSSSSKDKTTVTRLTGENCTKGISIELDGSVYPDSALLRISENKLGYYSAAGNCVIFLDGNLQETRRMVLPTELRGTPVLSEDMSAVFYCTETEIRAVDLETGISRLLRKQDKSSQLLIDTCFQGSVLQCFITQKDGRSYTEFISTANGESLGIDATLSTLYSHGEDYFLSRMEGPIREYLWGKKNGTPQCLVPANESAYLYNALSMSAMVSNYSETGKGTTLELYDLSTGKRTSSLTLSTLDLVFGITADPTEQAVWFLAFAEDGSQDLCRWDVTASKTTDPAIYTTVRYTRDNPDTAGIQECQAQADILGKKYGITIRLGNTVSQPEDYRFTYEHHVTAFRRSLEVLEQALAKFPEGFFTTLGNGKLEIGIIRSMQSLTPEGIGDPTGLQYFLNGNPYIALIASEDLEQVFYHELGHAVDAHVFGNSLAFDEWNKLNPKGFKYDGNYTDYLTGTDNTYLQGASKAFIDRYSMSYAKEDRARIFEYAMMPGMKDAFSSATMQKKLKQMCVGMRDAFDYDKDERVFPWEQYLDESLAYKKKK